MFDTHSHATCAPPSCATESSPYPTKMRSYSCAARCPSAPFCAEAAAGGSSPPYGSSVSERRSSISCAYPFPIDLEQAGEAARGVGGEVEQRLRDDPEEDRHRGETQGDERDVGLGDGTL